MLNILNKLCLIFVSFILSILVSFIAIIFTILSVLIIITILPYISFNVTYKRLKSTINVYLYNKRKIKWYSKNIIIWKAVSNTNSEQYIYGTENCILHSSRKNMWYKSCNYIEDIYNEKISHERFFKAHKLSIHNKIIFCYSTVKRIKGDI